MSLNQLFDQFVGGHQNVAAPHDQGNSNAGSLLDKVPGGMMGGLAAGGLLGVLAGNKKIRKKAGKLAGTAVGIGGAAILGAVAFKAYKNWEDGKSAASAQDTSHNDPTNQRAVAIEGGKFDPITTYSKDGQPFQLALIKAMIAAANADGHIDAEEQKFVFEEVGKLDLEAEDKALVFDTLQNPPTIHEIAALSAGIEQATEIYLVSRMAIDTDHPSEKAYLTDLATLLKLPEGLVLHLESQVEEADMLAA